VVALGVYWVPEILASFFLVFHGTENRNFTNPNWIGSVHSLGAIGVIRVPCFPEW
jgi:hypothetical protein